MATKLAALTALIGLASSQAVGNQTKETHPKLTWSKCSSGGSCSTVNGEITIDANWRWLHDINGYTNCYTGNAWNTSICSDNKSCATKCAVDGADYSSTYGITTSGNSLSLKFVTKGSYSTNIGSRVYLMASESKYEMFTLLNNEFTFDVDMSKIGCGLNSALYFVSMDADGGMSKYSSNKAGAKYGTGYCDAQCPRDLKFINGEANIDGWKSSTNDQNAGVGNAGSCCSEMDIWEANKFSQALTPHPCTTVGQSKCTGDTCGGTYSAERYAGVCDPDGCDFNPYRQGVKDFYGPGMTVNTNSKISVITQFTSTAQSRFYVSGGKTIAQPSSTWPGTEGNTITDAWCDKQKEVFGDKNVFKDRGGLAQMNKALQGGMVLVMSLWNDHYSNMLWLDSSYPLDKDPASPGIARGSCATSSGSPADTESAQADATVIFSNIKFGPINSTFKA